VEHLHLSTLKPCNHPAILQALAQPKYGVLTLENQFGDRRARIDRGREESRERPGRKTVPSGTSGHIRPRRVQRLPDA